MKVFIPFSESLVEELGPSLGQLVPFNLAYECLHVQDVVTVGTAEATTADQKPAPDHGMHTAKSSAKVVRLERRA